MNKAFNNVIKKHIVLSILTVFAVVLMMGGITYALFVVEDKNTENQKISVGNLDIDITSTSGTIFVRDIYPKKMTELAENENTYTYTISNTGDYTVNYTIYLTDNTSSILDSTSEYDSYTQLSSTYYQYINYRLDDESTAHNLKEVYNSSTGRMTLFTGFLVPGDSEDHSIQFWLDNGDTTTTGAPNAIIGNILALNINMEGVVTQSPSDKTLAALGLAGQVKEEPTEYNMFDYTYQGWYKEISSGDTLFNQSTEMTEGIYSMKDDLGTSYYFRGSQDLNNIVQFGTYDEDMYYYSKNGYYTTGPYSECLSESSSSSQDCVNNNKYASSGDSMYWRIIRINGDGSLRLMYIGTSVDKYQYKTVGKSCFNSYNVELMDLGDPKYAGYTYDGGEPSMIKQYLEKWYDYNMADEDGNIVESQFFNDTTNFVENQQFADLNNFNSAFVWNATAKLGRAIGLTATNQPSLKTAITDQTYGGIYYEKIGLINANEIVLSGVEGVSGATNYDLKEAYPFTINQNVAYWTMTPAWQTYYYDIVNVWSVISTGALQEQDALTPADVVPVINLSAETARSLIGTGSTTDYYRLP